MAERFASRIRNKVENRHQSALIDGKPADRVRIVEEGAKVLLRYSRQIEILDFRLASPRIGKQARTRREADIGHLMGLRSRLRASLIQELGTPPSHGRS